MKFLQIGSSTAEDHLPQLTKDSCAELVVLVEPLKIHHDKISQAYFGIPYVILDCAVVPNPIPSGKIPFFFHMDDCPNYPLSSISEDHFFQPRHGSLQKEKVVEISVPARTLSSILEEFNLYRLEYLMLDAEGIDDRILYSLDWRKFDIKQIYYEAVHINNLKLISFLEPLGFSVTYGLGPWGFDCLAIRP